MNATTKTQMVDSCADYEVNWFFDREPAEQIEVFRHIMVHGFSGFKSYSDETLFATCAHKGVFLMEE